MSQDSPFSTYLRPKQRGPGPAIIVAILFLAGAVGAAWYFFRPVEEAPPTTASAPPPAQEPVTSPVSTPDTIAIELPAVDTSDAFMRRMLSTLSAHPQFAEWLVTDELVRRFVATVVDLARGASPGQHLRFMAPEEPFAVREADGQRFIDPASYRRYDRMVATFESLDTQGTAELIRRLDPLFEAAHAEFGLPDRTFDRDLAAALSNVLAVRVLDQPPAVVAGESGWEYADPALQSRSSAARHLMRMGPQNARRVQAKVAALADALGIARR